MATTRERALDAAVEVVADGGMRALTHARVDARAGLPAGSTSNWFRTRDALVTGLVDWIAEQERADYRAGPPASVDAFIDALTRMIEVQTTHHAARTRARFCLFLDAHSAPALRRQRVAFEQWLQGIATTLGMPDPPAAARTILACGSGLVMHRLTVDPGAPVRPSVERAVRGCLPT
ncbi:TetR/AcrR family transcriptional regulator [Microbacterium sp. MC2]